MHGILIFLGLVIVINIIPNLGISIASFVIAGQSTNITCDGTMMPLTPWLYVNAAIIMSYIVTTLLLLTFAVILCFTIDKKHIDIVVNTTRKIQFTMTALYTLFSLAWNIVGAVALFRDSYACLKHAHSLWAMVLANLVFQWVFMIMNWCSNHDDKKYDE